MMDREVTTFVKGRNIAFNRYMCCPAFCTSMVR
jgi:hypothetical protein